MQVVLRPATPSDIEAMHRVRLAVRENMLRNLQLVRLADYHTLIASGGGWVVEDTGEIVAFGVADATRRNIWALFVAPSHERRGYGRRLLDQMVAWLFAQSEDPIWLTTEPGSRAESFYRTAGWRQVGSQANGELRFELCHDAAQREDVERSPASSVSARNFVLQQGLSAPDGSACLVLTRSLLFQPRIVGVWSFTATLFQSAPAFLILASILWWSALLPKRNPFDALHNRLLAGRGQRPLLNSAAAPRRFAQGMAAAIAMGIGICLLAGAVQAAHALEFLLLLAVSALVFGKLCLGSFVYFLLHGQVKHAVNTLPWGRG